MSDQQSLEAQARLTPQVRLARVEAVVNAASGSVGPNAAERLEALVRSYGLNVRVANAAPSEIGDAVRRAVDAGPDLVLVLAGDGTAALAAETCGPDGPLVAPLPGGTMNMLPHALYGRKAWPQALQAALGQGREQPVSGGEAGGRRFYVAAILGAPALFAEAREALRSRRFVLAWLRARRAFMRAVSGSLRFSLEEGAARKAEALTLMCPLVSRACDDETALEAAALDPHDATEIIRLGAAALVGRWRDDPAVTVERARSGAAWARGRRRRIPAILDGEPHRLDSPVEFRFLPGAFRALAPARDEAVSDAAAAERERVAGGAAADTVVAEAAKSLT